MSEETAQIGSKEADKRHRGRLLRLLGRMTIYYAIIMVVVAIALSVKPSISELLPVGGIEEYSIGSSSNSQDFEIVTSRGTNPELAGSTTSTNALKTGSEPTWLRDAKSLFLAMLITLMLMLPVSWVYKTIHEGHDFDHSIDETALILPAVVAGVVTVVQYSLALAFSLAGIVAGVRFRRALSDTFDTLFIFVAIGVGLAAGVGSVEIAVVITVFFNYTTVIVCAFGDGLESKYVVQKKTENRDRKLQAKAAVLKEINPPANDDI
jgi:hypothetical protein